MRRPRRRGRGPARPRPDGTDPGTPGRLPGLPAVLSHADSPRRSPPRRPPDASCGRPPAAVGGRPGGRPPPDRSRRAGLQPPHPPAGRHPRPLRCGPSPNAGLAPLGTCPRGGHGGRSPRLRRLRDQRHGRPQRASGRGRGHQHRRPRRPGCGPRAEPRPRPAPVLQPLVCARSVARGRITGLAAARVDGSPALLVNTHSAGADLVTVVIGCGALQPSAIASAPIPR